MIYENGFIYVDIYCEDINESELSVWNKCIGKIIY